MALFVLSLYPFGISVGVGAFVIGLDQISSFLSLSLVVEKCFLGSSKITYMDSKWVFQYIKRNKRYLNQSYDKSPYNNRKFIQSKTTTRKGATVKSNYTCQRLRTDFERSVGVTTVIKLVWLIGLRAQPSQSPAWVLLSVYESGKVTNADVDSSCSCECREQLWCG